MNSALVPLPIVIPLFAAAITLVFGRFRLVQQLVSLGALASVVGVSIALLAQADEHDVVVMNAGGWAAPLGITYVVDRLAGIMLVTSSLMLLVVKVYAIGQRGVADRHVGFAPIYLVLASGVAASFITGDMFNLFVAFEMMLAASYVLLTLGGRQQQVRAGMTYVVISLLFSAMFITALALLYAATGTVNMADLAERMPELSEGVRTGFSLLLILVFGIKAGLFPLFSWLPDSYPTAPGPVTAIFAGLLTKVGVYAIIRTQTLLFPPESQQGTALLIIGGLTMVVGVLGAIAEDDLKRLMSFHIVGQIGYMIFGIGLFTVAGLTAVVFYIAQTILVKTNLFLVVGLIDRHAGSSRMSRLGGIVRSAPVIAVFFAVPALSLAGLPPSSGFAGKFSLIDAGIDADQWAVVATALLVSLLTLFSMTKVWSGVFWGDPESAPALESEGSRGGPTLMVAATAATVAMSVAYVVFAGPIYDLAARAGADLIDPTAYIDAVLGAARGGHVVRASLRIPMLVLWLTTLWVLLWGDVSWANVLGGLLVAVAVLLFARLDSGGLRRTHFRPWWAFRYITTVLWQLLTANLRLAVEILTPHDGTYTGIIAVPIRGGSDAVVNLVANSITLTPGTMTIDVKRHPAVEDTDDDLTAGATLYVHGMFMRDVEAVRHSVLELEALALHAFGTDAEYELALRDVVEHEPMIGDDPATEDRS